MPKVEIRRGNFEFALRRFKRSVNKAGTLQEARERMYYEKPSSKKRRKKLRSKELARREQEKKKLELEKRK